MTALDFSTIAQAALRASPGLVLAWLPGGRLHGAEYDVRNPTRAMVELAAKGGYDVVVTAKSVIGISSPSATRRAAPDRRFFMPGRFLNGGWRGEVLRPAGVLVDRPANLAYIRHHRLAALMAGSKLQGVCHGRISLF